MEKILAKKICPNHSHEFHQSPDDPRKASRQKEPRKDAATLRSDVGMLGVEGGRSDWWGARRSIWRQGRVWQRVVSRGVVDGARESTSTAILSRLCDLELFPPPQEKAARAPIISSLLFRAPQGRRRRKGGMDCITCVTHPRNISNFYKKRKWKRESKWLPIFVAASFFLYNARARVYSGMENWSD